MNVIKAPIHRRKYNRRGGGAPSTSQLPQSIMCRLDANANPMLQRYLIDVNNAFQQRNGKAPSEDSDSPAVLSKKHHGDETTNHHRYSNRKSPEKSKPRHSTSKKKFLADPSVVLFGKSRFAHRVGIFAKTYKCSDTVANLVGGTPQLMATRKRTLPNDEDLEADESDFIANLESSDKQMTSTIRKKNDDIVMLHKSPMIKNRIHHNTNAGRLGLKHTNEDYLQTLEPQLSKRHQQPCCSKNNRSPDVNTVSEWSAGLTPENKPNFTDKEAAPAVDVEELVIPDNIVERIVSILPLWRTRTGPSLTKQLSRHLYTKMVETNPEVFRQSKDYGKSASTAKHTQKKNSRSKSTNSSDGFRFAPGPLRPQSTFSNSVGENDDRSDVFRLVDSDFMPQYEQVTNPTFRPNNTTLNSDENFQLNLDAIVGNVNFDISASPFFRPF